MTIRVSLRAVAFVVYTLALLGGAFGISYAVFEWRDDGASECDLARRSYFEGFITPNVDRDGMTALYEFLQENCE